MSTNTARPGRAIEYTVAGCVAIALIFWIFHQIHHVVAVRDRVEAVGTGCRPVVVAEANLLTEQHPGLKWSIGDTQVSGDIEPDKPVNNAL
ncbi:hypothetical protein [Paraburkholderia fungorum]|uniref:hypothetical protein n=1 Tax=Paraburkholderia fungorum TaxID=134537 RepID=UPI001621326D|nr:hypothetical protein [Paraburkholderia fungorum]MBB5547576.1 hypothetical protein [Paraburkholderia fungorum]